MNIKDLFLCIILGSGSLSLAMQDKLNIQLIEAAKIGNLTEAKYLVSQGASMEDCAALEAAAEHGHIDIVRFFIDQDIEYDEDTLWAAAQNGHSSIVTLLLDQSSNQSAATNFAFFIAVNKSQVDLACLLLLDRGASFNCLSTEMLRKLVKDLALRNKTLENNINQSPSITINIPPPPSMWQQHRKKFIWGTAAAIFGCLTKVLYESYSKHKIENFMDNKKLWIYWKPELTIKELASLPLNEFIALLLPTISARYDEFQYVDNILIESDNFLNDIDKEKILLETYIAQSKSWRKYFFTFPESIFDKTEKGLQRITLIRDAFINCQNEQFSEIS